MIRRIAGHWSITFTLSTGIAALVLIAVGSVLWVEWSSARRNTSELIQQSARLALDQLETAVRAHLQPAVHLTDFVTAQIERNEFDRRPPAELALLLRSSLAAAPQILAVAVVDADLQANRAQRTADGNIEIARADGRKYASIVRALDEIKGRHGGYWGEVVFIADSGSLINFRRALRRDGEFIGMVAATISIENFSRLAQRLGRAYSATGFILYGKDRVLAHPGLVNRHRALSNETPVVPIADIQDPVLQRLWSEGRPWSLVGKTQLPGVNLVEVPGDVGRHLALYRWLEDLGPTPLAVGVWFDEEPGRAVRKRLMTAGLFGVVTVVLAIIAAVVFGVAIAKPIRRIALGATHIGKLDLDQVEVLPRHPIRELDEQSTAFNTMLAGLRSFEMYVPRTLVKRLIERGGAGGVESEERELTVMFTDIVGFTRLAEGRSPRGTAALINHHFEILSACVEAEGGTIDKFIGDALMAFWGAPDEQPDAPARAGRAALAMAEKLASDNAERRERGETEVRVRIGIHTGPVVVGNIGSPGRINYTIVGDTVNTCQRIEALGKEFDAGEDVTILLSGEAASRIPSELKPVQVGAHRLKGKQDTVEVYRLDTQEGRP
jgi:adenylate cyclase